MGGRGLPALLPRAPQGQVEETEGPYVGPVDLGIEARHIYVSFFAIRPGAAKTRPEIQSQVSQ